MPFASPRVIIEYADPDKGDEKWDRVNSLVAELVKNDLLSFEFNDHERKIDECKLTIRNTDGALFDNPVFVRGQKFVVAWGWPGRLSPPRRMVVRKVTGGDPLLVILHDTTALLDRKKAGRKKFDAPDSEFVREVAEEYGYSGALLHLEETPDRHDIVQPQTMTDARFLGALARRNGFIFYIDDTGLHWHSRRWDEPPARTWFYKTDPGQGSIIGEPEFEADLSQGVSSVRVLAIDPLTKEAVDETVGPSDAEDTSLGDEIEDGDPRSGEPGKRAGRVMREDVRHLGFKTRAEALAEARARYRETAQNRYKLKLSIIGDAQFGAKQLFELWGRSATVDGLWYAKEVTHKIEPGTFTTDIEARKDALREVNATKKAEALTRGNKTANQTAPATLRAKQRGLQMQALRRASTLRIGPDGEPRPTWFYVDDGSQLVSAATTMTPAELAALSARSRLRIAQESGSGRLPDA
jgi:phage protein D